MLKEGLKANDDFQALIHLNHVPVLVLGDVDAVDTIALTDLGLADLLLSPWKSSDTARCRPIKLKQRELKRKAIDEIHSTSEEAFERWCKLDGDCRYFEY